VSLPTLTPLGDRVLIRPDQAPQQTESGLHLVEHWKPEQTGTVVAVGFAAHPRKAEAFELAESLEHVSLEAQGGGMEPVPGFDGDHATVLNAAQLLRELTGREPLVKEGDAVIFPWSAGQEIFLNDGEDRLFLMREADILAVIEPEVV
jgi:co-chaperonin GroES (HSP10)